MKGKDEKTLKLKIKKHSVILCFSERPNTGLYSQVREMLLSSALEQKKICTFANGKEM